MSQSCPLCFKIINGDAEFFQFHVEHCLDSDGIVSPLPVALEMKEENENNLAQDEAFARSLLHDEEQEVTTIALKHESAKSRGKKRALPDETLNCCPSCGKYWEELEIVVAERDSHVDTCIEFEPKKRLSSKELEGGNSRFVLGLDEARTASEITPLYNIISLLSPLLVRSHAEGKTTTAFVSVETSYIGTKIRDWGWGCGYRNAQMLFSSLRQLNSYSNLARAKLDELPPIPTILEFQQIIEAAWKRGHDPSGAAHFKNKLIGSKKWIGTTEIYTAFTVLGIRARVVDFPNVKGVQTHATLVRWIIKYFSTDSSKVKSETSTDAFSILRNSNGSPIHKTVRQPLYLQHQGHSRTVVGVDQGKNGNWLLVFDCGKTINSTIKKASMEYDNSSSSPAKRSKAEVNSSSSESPDSKYSAFFDQIPGAKKIWGNLHGGSSGLGNDEAETVERATELNVKNYSKLLEGYRVSMTNLSKKDEYQIMYVEEGLLTDEQIAKRKIVPSIRVES